MLPKSFRFSDTLCLLFKFCLVLITHSVNVVVKAGVDFCVWFSFLLHRGSGGFKHTSFLVFILAQLILEIVDLLLKCNNLLSIVKTGVRDP